MGQERCAGADMWVDALRTRADGCGCGWTCDGCRWRVAVKALAVDGLMRPSALQTESWQKIREIDAANRFCFLV